ncbi:hypothetical protein [Rhodococcoides fascians]|uniref:hypothetical protein n=1 Tax=Rhodococcoides fascians TaxID=1828 RepID=UPI0027839190|nr:hypothetical protein [Rhodococcus fascians]MDQ0284457.1 hypothetical protein [Rhodococcus fascians]
MGFADRFSLGTVASDYWRSVRVFGQGDAPDYGARAILVGLPSLLTAVGFAFQFQLGTPTAILPAVALLAGVLLAAAGQVLTMRARVADSVVLSQDKRLRGHIRETMSGLLLAAVAALVDALVLGTLAVSVTPGQPPTFPGVVLTGASVWLTTYLFLMFLAAARRLYATYLEVFEGGNPLPKRTGTDHSSGVPQ